ncbi:hypothetical protein [uncultured Jannaschia sp.]|uniref:hypothetical protein n=1 Tax=uncultured Jannaschia sp. TaxID=293347 RepID=UPI00261768C1|nr:hypothetical protein [uncultured Jannaschia sp.]
MPKPAEFVAAIPFAALAWIVADRVVRVVLPKGMRSGRFRETHPADALLVVWRVGGRAVRTWMDFLCRDIATIADPRVSGTLSGDGARVGLIAEIVGRVTR